MRSRVRPQPGRTAQWSRRPWHTRCRSRTAPPLAVSLSLNRKLPVADQVYEALKKAIVTLQLMPGASISENRICRTFGVSRTPVRSAIARLREEGLIDVYPQQGSFVAPIRLAADRRQPVRPQGAGGRDPARGGQGAGRRR